MTVLCNDCARMNKYFLISLIHKILITQVKVNATFITLSTTGQLENLPDKYKIFLDKSFQILNIHYFILFMKKLHIYAFFLFEYIP